MDEQKPDSQTLFPHETGHHHRTARERQRRGPMWGCLRTMIILFGGGALLLFIVIGGGWWYLGTASFAELVRLRIEKTLESRLGREVQIKTVAIPRGRPQRVILNDMRIANAPGAVNPYFATVEQVVITGGIESFWGRELKVSRVDVINPRMNFEVFPEGTALTHNFPRWKSGPRSRYEIYRLELGQMFVRGGSFQFLDRRHQITADVTGIESRVNITRAENLYEGIMSSPRVRVALQDYVPFDVDMRGGFRYTPGVLALNSIALRGRGIEAFVSGRLDPLTEGAYNLRIRSGVELERIAEIFRVDRTLEGRVALDTNLRGRQGDFRMTGGWVTPQVVADTYELTDAEGTLDVTGQQAVVDVTKATYGGGTIGAHYTLGKYGEPYPMNVELRYDRISIEQLFSDWGIENTGLRGAATGRLTYEWSKDRLLDGAGRGNAQLSRNAVAFSNAKYPVAVAGSTDFTLNRGVVSFTRAELDTDKSHVSLTGTLRIDDVVTNLAVQIRSSDFSELDRIAYNFAHAADKRDYELLGLGGAGQISGRVSGPIKTPNVNASIRGTGVTYNDVLLGAAEIEMRYDGRQSQLTFDRAIFMDSVGRLALTGTIRFPDRGPSPVFDIAVDATNYPVDRAIAAVGLDFKVGPGRGTGRLLVAGTPENGRVTFAGMTIYRGDAVLKLTGDVNWLPGEGNVRFDLDIDAQSFPITDIITFLDLGELPVTGNLTGQLHLEGPKSALEGAGAVTIRSGTIYGEPVDVATADIAFTQGRLRATNVSVTAPAGQLTGEAEFDLNTQRFSYTIASSSIDLSRLKLLESIRGLLGGNIEITSTGAGTLDQPELVLEARLNQATLRGLALPPDSPPPSIYIAIRGGRLIVRGAIADIVTIEGEGSVGEQMEVDGLVKITVADIARVLKLSPAAATIPASGNMVVELQLGGRLTPIEALRIEGTVPTFNLRVSDHEFTPREPLRFALREGRVIFESFDLQHADALVSVTGFAEITGQRRLNVDVRGRVEAALLQLFASDVRADGHVVAAITARGTMATPVITGTAELQDAEVRFAGFPQVIDEINGTLQFRGDSVEIVALRATVGGGTVVAGGEIALNGITPESARITMVGTGVTLRYFEGVTLEGNFDLRLTGDLDQSLLQGEVNVTRALYFKDFDLQQTVLSALVSRGGVVPVTAADWQNRVALRIQVLAPNTLAVENNIADVTGTAELDVTGTLGNPVILGSVDLDEGGTVTFQSIDYRVVRGTISFQNPFRTDPYFDVTLEGRVSGGVSTELESGPVELTVNITGTLEHLVPSITSDPPASDITLFSLFGLGALTRPGETTASAGSIGTSLVLGGLISNLGSRILPFADSFSYDPGLLDTTTGAAEPKVTFEKRVSNDVRLLVVYNMNSHESREVIEWIVNRDWTVQLTRDGLQKEFRLDGRFRRRYEGRWTWGNRGRQNAEIFPVGRVTDVITPSSAPLPQTTDTAAIAPGTTVSEIRFRADGGFDTSTLLQYLTFKEGDALSRRELQNSTKSLHATGNFRDVRIDAQPDGSGGTVITLVLFLNYRIDRIAYETVSGANRRRAEQEVQIRRGDVLSLNAVDDSALAIQEELNQAGYLEVTVDPEVTFRRAENLANVIFHIELGPLAKVATVELEGNLAPFTREQILSRMREKPGSTFKISDARRDATRIRTYLARESYRRADVEFAGHTYDADANTVALRYNVDAGPAVRVDVTGVPRRAVRRQLPFRGDQEYSEDAIARSAEDILVSYQRQGYYGVTVDTEGRLDPQTNTWVTTFVVTPGQRYRLADVRFTGNTKISDKELERLVETSPRGGFRSIIASLFRRRTGVTREQLADDRLALEAHYRLQGFSQATVDTPEVQTNPDGTMIVSFPITEGPQTILSQVNIEGVEQVDAGDLPNLQLEEGMPLNPQMLNEDIIALQSFYSARGNAEVQVTHRTEESADKTTAKLTYVIAEGPQIKVGDIVVRGNTYTDDDVVLRKVDLEKGDPFTYTSILEAQRELYRLGIFQRADIQAEQAGTSVADRNVTIEVEEGRNLTVSGSLGLRADTAAQDGDRDFSYRVAAGIAHRNLFGTGRYLGLQAVGTAGGVKEQELFITYREPFIGRYNVPVQLTIFQTDDATRKETRLLQRGLSIEASKIAGYQTRWSLQYQYKIAECIEGLLCEDQTIISPGGDRSFLNIQISSITPTFFWDKRDDIIDPHRGFFTSASVEYAFPLFSAKANFTKEFVQGAWYLPVTERSVVALSARIGLIQPVGDSVVPLSERFTAGGDTSHRAFPLDLLGTLCAEDNEPVEGCEATLFDLNENAGEFRLVPLGGNSMFIANAEYRFPIFSSLGGAVFADIGNVFASTIDFGDLRYGAGAGLRYLSPVGPLRFDVGIPLNKREYDRSFSWFITLGYAF